MKIEWLDVFHGLRDVRDPAWLEVAASAEEHSFPARTTLFRPGSPCGLYPFVVEGCIRVTKESQSGREVLLYRVMPGEVCMLSTAVLVSGGVITANAATEVDTRLVCISADRFKQAYEHSPGFRDYVVRSHAMRFRQMIELVDAIAFGQVGPRLVNWLALHAEHGDEIVVSHQDLAVELGTAREVVSRQLKDLEKRGIVALGRGAIAIRDRAALQALARGA